MAGILDFIFGRGSKADTPPPSTTPPTTPKGGSGRQHLGGFLDFDETNNALRGKAGLGVFEEMWRTDATVRRTITMCVNPIVAGTWEVRPYKDNEDADAKPEDQDIADFITWTLKEAMKPKLTSHLWTALTVAGRSGFCPFEAIYKPDKWNDRQVFTLKTLLMMRPKSVDRWIDDSAGELLGLEQFVPGHGRPAGTTPASDLVYYRFGAEGDNWEGQSLLRPAYKSWMRKEGLERIDVMGHEKTRIGVPTLYPPQGMENSTALAEMSELMASIRAGDETHVVMPGPHQQWAKESGQGWFWEYVTPSGDAAAANALQEALKYHVNQMDAVVIAEFMRLGQQGVGARATADVQQDPFWMFVDTLAQIVVADTLNEQLIPQLVKFNFDTEHYPRLECSLIDSTTLQELADYVQKLTAAGALTPEPTLEAYLRKRADLTPRDEAAIAKIQEQEAAQAQAELELAHQQGMQSADQSHGHAVAQADQQNQHAIQQIKTKAAVTPKPKPGKQLSLDDEPIMLARADRPLKTHEAYMSLDRIESAIDDARGRLETGAGQAVLALAQSLAEQASKGRKLRPARGPYDLQAAIREELAGLYHTGRETVKEELQRQMVGDPYHSTGPMTLAAGDLPGDLWARAQHAADVIRQAITAALKSVGFHQGTDQAALQVAAETAGRSALRNQALEHAAAALNAGRVAQAADDSDQIAGTYYTSILDGNRCPDCARADDDVLRTLTDPVRLSRVPPNRDCNGGGRCRCMEAYVLRAEAPASA